MLIVCIKIYTYIVDDVGVARRASVYDTDSVAKLAESLGRAECGVLIVSVIGGASTVASPAVAALLCPSGLPVVSLLSHRSGAQSQAALALRALLQADRECLAFTCV